MSVKSIISKRIEKKLGGYKVQLNKLDLSLPEKLSKEKSVGIIGGGLAGISAAIFLAERGFSVKIFEKETYLGGKVGSWPVKFNDGFSTNVEHGFHAFFRQYYNLRNLLRKIDSYKYLIPIDDYLILTKEHGNFGFKDLDTVPVLNILSMAKTGIYSYKDALLNPGFRKMISLLSYNREKTFAKFDNVSFKDFADDVKLPREMQLMFTTFSRAFFAEPQYISMAELIKSFHSYFLSNDLGLLYDVLNDDFDLEKHMNAKDKIVVRGPYTSQFDSQITGGVTLQYMSRLWSFDASLIDYIAEVYKEMFDHMQRRLQEGGYIDIEHMMFHHLKFDLIETISKIGVEGNIAPNGVGIKE